MNQGIDVRFDEGTNEFVFSLSIPGLRDFEVRDTILSRGLLELSEALENEGV